MTRARLVTAAVGLALLGSHLAVAQAPVQIGPPVQITPPKAHKLKAKPKAVVRQKKPAAPPAVAAPPAAKRPTAKKPGVKAPAAKAAPAAPAEKATGFAPTAPPAPPAPQPPATVFGEPTDRPATAPLQSKTASSRPLKKAHLRRWRPRPRAHVLEVRSRGAFGRRLAAGPF